MDILTLPLPEGLTDADMLRLANALPVLGPTFGLMAAEARVAVNRRKAITARIAADLRKVLDHA